MLENILNICRLCLENAGEQSLFEDSDYCDLLMDVCAISVRKIE